MAKFTDMHGQEWEVALDIEVAREVRKRLRVNLLVVEGVNQLAADPILLVDALYLLCEAQCKARKMTDVDFGRSLGGQALQDAGDAIVDALLDFSPPRQREILQQMRSAGKAMQETLAGMVEKTLQESAERMRQMIPGSSSTATPESSDSTPAG